MPEPIDIRTIDVAEDEWFIWTSDLARERPDILAEVEAFEGDPKHGVAQEGAEWLKRQAARERACITRLLVLRDRLVAFYSLASAEVEISRPKELERLQMLGGGRVPASHIEWVVRSRNFKHVGERLLLHATIVAREVAGHQGNLVLSLDPYDDGTARMWREFGFVTSATELGEGLRRMYLPLFGYRSLVSERE